MEKILVSFCLIGGNVRYHGGDAFCDDPQLRLWGAEGRLLPLCPEVAAGSLVPRPPSEIVGKGGGKAVFQDTAQVMHKDGSEVTSVYKHGADIALALAKQHHIKMAILKSGSPSCGNIIYDGSFSGRKIKELGVVAYLLSEHGVRVFNENQIKEAKKYLTLLEKKPHP